MPRHSRIKSSTNIYHIVIKGADSQVIFYEDRDKIKYLDYLEYYKHKCNFVIFAYCLMANHIHLLIKHSDDTSLSSIFRHLNTSYACWFNQKYNRTGYVQDGRYYSEPVETEKYLFNVINYIHYNPSKAGLELYPGEKYMWSSYSDYIIGNDRLVDISYIINTLGGLDSFISLHNVLTEEKCLEIDTCKRRIPDDVVIDMIDKLCNCTTPTEFGQLSMIERRKNIIILYKKGVSKKQLNRLTGTPRGIIDRILK